MAVAAMAQNGVSFGVKAGVTSANLSGDAVNSLQNLLDFSNGAISTSSRTGFFAGGFANIPIGERFSIEPGVYYSQKGYTLQGGLNIKGAEFLGINAKSQLNTSYIDVPVLLKANLSGFQVFAGPQVSYLTNAQLRTTAGALGFNIINTKTDALNQFNRWDAAVTGGVAYQFPTGFSISASYDYGLMKADASQSLNAYNRTIKVGLGYRF